MTIGDGVAESGEVRIGALSVALGRPVHELRRLADRGLIPSRRTAGGHRVFRIDEVRAALSRAPNAIAVRRRPAGEPSWRLHSALSGIDGEDVVWRRLSGELGFDESARDVRIVRYAFTEMLNNALDHSSGSVVDIAAWVDSDQLAFEIADDGIGAFERIRGRLGLDTTLDAIGLLTVGKSTTMPERHSGEGIFFTSKALDLFALEANGLRWTVDNARGDQAVGIAVERPGTTVFGHLDRPTQRELREVFEHYSPDTEFTRTRPVVKLFGLGVRFVSRSEARRLLASVEPFTEIELDFAGVEEVGQGFVDEVFRVWPLSHPGAVILPLGMNPAVAFMVDRARRGA